MSTKTVSLVLFLFTALTLTHAAFIDYRSGAAETQPQFRTTQDKMAGQMLYLQVRKMSAVSLDLGLYNSRSTWRGVIRSKWTESGFAVECLNCLSR